MTGKSFSVSFFIYKGVGLVIHSKISDNKMKLNARKGWL